MGKNLGILEGLVHWPCNYLCTGLPDRKYLACPLLITRLQTYQPALASISMLVYGGLCTE